MDVKVIFLDFDGVMNSIEWLQSERYKLLPKKGGVMGLDRVAAGRIQKLCDMTGAKIVVSSTWRMNRSRTELCDVLLDVGVTAMVLDKTPVHRVQGRQRGDEIQAWLDDQEKCGRFNVTSMVIIDDDSDMRHLLPWLVQTRYEDGFVDRHIDECIEMLKKPMPSGLKGRNNG